MARRAHLRRQAFHGRSLRAPSSLRQSWRPLLPAQCRRTCRRGFDGCHWSMSSIWHCATIRRRVRRGLRLARRRVSSARRGVPTILPSTARRMSRGFSLSRHPAAFWRKAHGDARTSIDLNYLLFDFGGRSGAIESARQNLFAANLAHNATLQNTVLQAESPTSPTWLPPRSSAPSGRLSRRRVRI